METDGENITPIDKFRNRSEWLPDEIRAAELVETAVNRLEQDFGTRFEQKPTLEIHRHKYPELDKPIIEVVYKYVVRDADDEDFVRKQMVATGRWVRERTGM